MTGKHKSTWTEKVTGQKRKQKHKETHTEHKGGETSKHKGPKTRHVGPDPDSTPPSRDGSQTAQGTSSKFRWGAPGQSRGQTGRGTEFRAWDRLRARNR